MALTSEEKKKLIFKHSREKGDTGSPEVQIALLSAQIDKLVEHLKEHSKDVHSPVLDSDALLLQKEREK